MKKYLALALALAVAPFAASAGELNYTYVEGAFARVDIDDLDDGDGYQLRGSAAIAENVYLYGGYGSVDANNYDADFSETQLGVGYRHALSERADFIAELGYIGQELDITGLGSASADGGRVSAGFRGLMADNFEAWVKGGYTDGGDFDGDFSGTVGAQLTFNRTWGLVGEIEAGQDITKYMVGVRASF